MLFQAPQKKKKKNETKKTWQKNKAKISNEDTRTALQPKTST
jgi:hypothetical protein